MNRDVSAKILIIDDEKAVRDVLRVNLTSAGFVTAEAERGALGLTAASEFHPHLILLDLGLPDMHGLDVLKALRKWTEIPVIVLTVVDDQAAKVALLDAGADDYLTKPFGTPELLARVRVSLRHHPAREATPLFQSGTLQVDINARRVERAGETVKLTGTEFELLAALVRSAGRVVPQAQLLRQIWGAAASDQTHYLRIYVGQLRKKLEQDPARPQHILTEPGLGYRIV